MATILLSAAGATLGAAFGPLGIIAGRALGAAAGYMIDQSLIRATLPDQQGPRLGDVDLQTSTEGRAIPRVYGRVRLSGQLIWATRYEEQSQTQSGGKGGPVTTNFSYFANFAVGLCAGEISHIARVWADGAEIDTTALTLRVHHGSETQPADSLILARQPNGAPAYRGLAYVVFERLPLGAYGNRIPQLAFEVIRAVDTLEPKIRAITLIPGATEYGYAPTEVRRQDAPGAWVSENRHVTYATSDFAASLDELLALCPNLQWVSLVVGWFGTDLRAGSCQLKPGVENTAKATNVAWSVNGISRGSAYQVSQISGAPAFGGTPSDASVIAAIQAIRARGLKVMLYPFILMDIPAGNALANPYGGASQPVYPWRGRITCHPAPGQSGTVDKTATAASQIAAFVGTATAAHFSTSASGVSYSGPAEWSFRRFILHHAKLAMAAGGVDGFLMGSELRGLTTVRGAGNSYPFVSAMVTLASEVKAVLGASTKLSYGADWTEWFGHQPADGSNDVTFHLDPFWAASAVDFVGIDNYLPLTDARHGAHLDAGAYDDSRDLAALMAGFNSGEHYDWYYGSDADRTGQNRRAIQDGTYGKPWVFRPKDLKNWWSHAHFDRIGGTESLVATQWVSQSKPIWFTEIGCPSVDLGANQPNVFPDKRSSEGAAPHFSRGARDDLMARRFAEAVATAWNPDDPDAPQALNPHSTVYGGPMVDPAGLFLWAWDARPFPAFPALGEIWADGGNWANGHWLNGRLGGTSLQGLIRAILADVGFDAAEFGSISGHVDGFVIDSQMSPRAALEPLLAAYLIDAHDTGTHLRFASRQRRAVLSLLADDLRDSDGQPLTEIRRAQESELPASVAVTVSDALRDYRRTTVNSRRLVGGSQRAASADLPVVAPVDATTATAETWLQDVWSARETLRFTLSQRHAALEPGDIIDLPVSGTMRRVMIERIEDGLARQIEACSVDPGLYAPVRVAARETSASRAATFGAPVVQVLDIARGVDTDPQQPLIAASATPWPGSVAVLRSLSGASWSPIATLTKRATMGVTTTALPPGPTGLWDRGHAVTVQLHAGTLASASALEVLAGANACAIQTAAGRWEILQFQTATLVAANTWTLSSLLRGQRGSEDALGDPVPAGSAFVLLDDALVPLPIALSDLGIGIALKVGPARHDYTNPAYLDVTPVPSGRGLLPFAPVHLRAVKNPTTSAISLSWIRRSRAAGADSWVLADAPLGETSESYQMRILSGATLKRQVTVSSPAYTYPLAEQTADFGGAAASFTLEVRQISAALGPGLTASALLTP